MNDKNILPTKLAPLLEMALIDYDLAVQDPAYEIDMYNWCRVDPERDVCQICLAGAVIVREILNKEPEHSWQPEVLLAEGLITESDSNALHALDALRLGAIESALNEINDIVSVKHPDFPITAYWESKTGWRESMNELLAYLKEHDL